MNFIKRHYEKILLGVVLLGLAVAVAMLPVKIAAEKQDLADQRDKIVKLDGKPLTNLDEATYSGVLHRVEKSTKPDFTKPHNLFNPVPWQRKPDGQLQVVRTGSEIGAEALQVTNLHSIYTTIAFESVGASGSNYLVSITRDAEVTAAKRRKKSVFVEVGVKNEFSTLVSAKAKPDAPDKPDLVLLLNDSGETVSISADKPFRRVDGHSADLKYDPEKKNWNLKRVGDKISFAGDEFTVAAINQVATNQFEVIVSARSTGKKYIRTFSGESMP
ncbi:MAG: hypothetical protein RLZZ350_2192 [Verrucomicrobiota bacterium]|jgi:hypothetical protein